MPLGLLFEGSFCISVVAFASAGLAVRHRPQEGRNFSQEGGPIG